MAYTPRPVPQTSLDSEAGRLSQFIDEENRTIARAMQENEQVQFTVLYAPPDRPREGMVVYADGVHWNPGGGAGLYTYVGGIWAASSIAPLVWTAYTPTVVAGSGALAAYNASGRYQRIGRTVFVTMLINITANGTGASWIGATLPIAAVGNPVFSGRENAIAGWQLQSRLQTTIQMLIVRYDNGYPGGNNAQILLSGFYET